MKHAIALCHCGELANNPTMNLCNAHIDELRAVRRLERETWLAMMRTTYRYFIPDGDLGVMYEDSGRWRSYEISDAAGNTPEEFLAGLSISEVDQDGGEIDTYSFDDAGGRVQAAILAAVGLCVCKDCGRTKPEYTKNFPDQCKHCYVRTWGKAP